MHPRGSIVNTCSPERDALRAICVSAEQKDPCSKPQAFTCWWISRCSTYCLVGVAILCAPQACPRSFPEAALPGQAILQIAHQLQPHEGTSPDCAIVQASNAAEDSCTVIFAPSHNAEDERSGAYQTISKTCAAAVTEIPSTCCATESKQIRLMTSVSYHQRIHYSDEADEQCTST